MEFYGLESKAGNPNENGGVNNRYRPYVRKFLKSEREVNVALTSLSPRWRRAMGLLRYSLNTKTRF
jgi:hypothetical protein